MGEKFTSPGQQAEIFPVHVVEILKETLHDGQGCQPIGRSFPSPNISGAFDEEMDVRGEHLLTR
jgi:hypothetical protein